MNLSIYKLVMAVLMKTCQFFGSQLTQQQEFNEMLASIEEIQLLQNIMHAVEAKKTLDIGSYCYVNITCVLL